MPTTPNFEGKREVYRGYTITTPWHGLHVYVWNIPAFFGYDFPIRCPSVDAAEAAIDRVLS